MAGYDNRLRDKQTILGFSREYHKSAPDPKKCNPKSYMEITDLINQIFSAQGMNQVNASITSSKKVAEIAISPCQMPWESVLNQSLLNQYTMLITE